MIYLLGLAIVGLAVSPWAVGRVISNQTHRFLLREQAEKSEVLDRLMHLAGKPMPNTWTPLQEEPEENRQEEIDKAQKGWAEF